MLLTVDLPNKSISFLDSPHRDSGALSTFSMKGFLTAMSDTVDAAPIVGAADVANTLELLVTNCCEPTNLIQ